MVGCGVGKGQRPVLCALTKGLGRFRWRPFPVASMHPQICFAGWVGDQDATFYGLQAALLHMFASANFNYVNVGSDVGGFGCVHASKKRNEEREGEAAKRDDGVAQGGGRGVVRDGAVQGCGRGVVRDGAVQGCGRGVVRDGVVQGCGQGVVRDGIAQGDGQGKVWIPVSPRFARPGCPDPRPSSLCPSLPAMSSPLSLLISLSLISFRFIVLPLSRSQRRRHWQPSGPDQGDHAAVDAGGGDEPAL